MLQDVFTWQFARCAADLPSYLKVILDAHGWARWKEHVEIIRLQRPFPCHVCIRRNTSDVTVLREVLVEEMYAASLPEPPRTILDFGANIGLTSLYLSRRYPDATIHAFEPVPANYALLKRQCELNGLTQVRAHLFGLGDHDHTITLRMDKAGHYGMLHQEKAAIPSVMSFEVRIREVTAVLRECEVTDIDLLKIDVEGAEEVIFKALGDRLASIRCIIGELHAADGNPDRIWGTMDVLRRTHWVDIDKRFGGNCLLFRAWSRQWVPELKGAWQPISVGLS